MRAGMTFAGRYRLDGNVGSGGFFEVWRALDLENGGAVAVKVGKASLDGSPEDAQNARDLVREASALRQVQHPNIVRVLDTGEADGRPFIVMEFLEGVTLRQLLTERGSLDERTVRRIGVRIADALDAAHQRGILHNDVKPENIMLVRDEPYLIDFGVARDLNATIRAADATELAGTLRYLAPERIAGEAPTASSDLYALAATLYEAVAGEPPFAGSHVFRAAGGAAATPAPLREIAPDASAHLESVLSRGLAAIARQRFADAGAFREALEGEAQRTVRMTRAELLGDTVRSAPVAPNAPVAQPPVEPKGPAPSRKRRGLAGALPVMAAGAILVVAAWTVGTMVRDNGLFADDAAGQQDSVDIVPTATPTTPPPTATPTATPTPQPTEEPVTPEPTPAVTDEADDEERGGRLEPVIRPVRDGLGTVGNGFNSFVDIIGERLNGAPQRLRDIAEGFGGAMDSMRGRFGRD